MGERRLTVSVCLASYNGEDYIAEQIRSILPQLCSHDELIISDNGSNDATLKIIFSFKDERIKLVKCIEPGVVKNFELAIKNAKNEILILCDQDDVWLPGRIDDVLKEHRTSVLVSVGFNVVDANLDKILGVDCVPKLSFLSTLIKNRFLGCSMSFHRSACSYILPFPANIGMHDWWIALMCLLKGEVTYVSKPLFLYRRHSKNASPTTEVSKFSIADKIKMRIIMLLAIGFRICKRKKV
ncbi:glycosyltransferase [Vibrio tasmaniensis]|uniref:glycosyltransferase n=1 Tax=Vibrio tasmaniensis TaxID=212663 RepID=UPI001080080E|nr:glycosyltransferase [Vibrio tasmaniensis]